MTSIVGSSLLPTFQGQLDPILNLGFTYSRELVLDGYFSRENG